MSEHAKMKRIICIQVFVLLCVIASFGQNDGGAGLEIIPVELETLDTSLPEIPWIGKDLKEFFRSEPLFSIAADDTETGANGWVGVNRDEIIIRVVVSDDYHINTRSSAMIWDGDAIQFGIDADGDGVGHSLKTEAYTGPNDASITFALTDDGPRAWAHYYGHPEGPGEFKNLTLDIERDNRNYTTTYDIRLPWESFQMQPGISSYMGVAFQINDTDIGPKQKRIYWGLGAGGNLRPGLFKKLRIAAPNEYFISVQPIKSKIWSPADKAEVMVAIHADHPVDLGARYGALNRQVTIQLEEPPLLKRYAVQLSPGDLPLQHDSLFVEVKGDGLDGIRSGIEIDYSGSILTGFRETIDALVHDSPHSLYTRHLQSIDAIVLDEWNKAMIRLDEDPYHLQLLADHMKIILDGFQRGLADWDHQPDGSKSLVFAFLSSQDRSLQFYKLSLPVGFSHDKRYPLIIDLHGSGSPYTLDFFTHMFKGNRSSQDENGIDAIIASPWGRGNNRYMGMAETDVWDVMRDVKHTFHIDQERQYLSGFSMGGYGTWALAIHAPEHWAAIAVCAGGDMGAPSESGLALNIADIPALIWHGDSDGTVPVTYAIKMQKALQLVGNDPEMVIVPGRGHDFRAEDRVLVYNWLLSHQRKAVTNFSYISSSLTSRGRNGVEVLDIYPAATLLPVLEVEISGNLVKISSQHTSRIRVIMGEGGLNLSGDVQCVWNGKEVYQGPVTEKVFTGK